MKDRNRFTRREVAIGTSTIAITGLAGCSGANGEGTSDNPPESDEDTEANQDSQDQEEEEQVECSGAVRVVSEFEEFPSESELEEALNQGEESATARLQITIENTIDVSVEYDLTAQMETATDYERFTRTGILGGGGTESFTFEETDDPRYLPSYSHHSVNIESECSSTQSGDISSDEEEEDRLAKYRDVEFIDTSEVNAPPREEIKQMYPDYYAYSEFGVVLTDLSSRREESTAVISGTATNESDTDYSFVLLTFLLYDGETVVARAIAEIGSLENDGTDKLKSGEEVLFEATGPTEGVNGWEIEDIAAK